VADIIVNILDLTGKVTAPVKDTAPVTTFNETTQYTGTIVWKKADDTEVSGNFAADTEYKAVVTLAPKTGFTFTGVAANAFTYSGATSVTNTAGSGTITITFPATAEEGANTVVNILDLTSKVTAPVKDAAPITAFSETTQYTGTIAWKKADDTEVSGNFAAGTVYKAVVTLTAKSGFTFAGVAADAFTYSGATSVTNTAGNGTVTITFPVLADTTVTDLNLTGKVTAPVKDATPATTAIDTTQYTGTIVWKKADDTAVSGNFAAGTVYKAVVTLTAQTGFTFAGVAANAFAYNGATTVTNAADSGTVTITFPETEAAPTPPEGGKGITFTGIASQHDGEYATFRSSGSTDPTGGEYLFGSTSSSGITGALISNGSVTIPVYLLVSTSPLSVEPYTGSDAGIRIYLYIKTSSSFTQEEVFEGGSGQYTINSVNFTNGSASVNVGSGGGGGTGVDAKWQGTYTDIGGKGDFITVTANSATYTDDKGTNQPPTNGITTQTGGDVMYSDEDAGDWVYILFGDTKVGVAMSASDGKNTRTMIAIGSDGVEGLINGAKGNNASFSPEQPSISGNLTGEFSFVGEKSN
jgi:hypothetical protein